MSEPMEIVSRDGYEFAVVPIETLVAWAGVPPRYRTARWQLDDPALVAGVHHAQAVTDADVRRMLLRLASWSSENEWNFVILQGPRGRGKTTYAAATIRRVAHLRPRWVEWPTLVASVADSWRDGGETALLADVVSSSFLVVDDFGKELTGFDDARMPSWQKRVAFELINGRCSEMRPTLLTTELAPEEMGARLDEAITSRLVGFGEWIDLSASPDYRLLGGSQ